VENLDPSLPVIALTAHAMAEDRERIMKAGVDGYVAKPIDSDKLRAALALAMREPRRTAGRK
jgi:CheY-like chemotaxis protein